MPIRNDDLAQTVHAMRPVVPARDFELSGRFYEEPGFRPRRLSESLVELHLGAHSFVLQNYYVAEWANNFVMHMRVADVSLWWERVVELDLAGRYGAKISSPREESWGVVMGLADPSGVLWRIAQSTGAQ